MIDAPSSTWFTVPAEWGWPIAIYLFIGGLAGGCYFLAAVIDLVGRPNDRPLARLGYYAALPLVILSGIVLIFHLTRPERFWHLLLEVHTLAPIVKYWSPISIGAWALLVFGVFAFASFLAALSESGRLSWRWPLALRPPGVVGSAVVVLGGLMGLYIAGYTGVLLSVTNRPIWADTPLLGMLFVVSATSISAALLVLLGRRSRWTLPGVASLHRLDGWVIVLELIVLVAVIASLGAALRGWLNAWGLLLVVGVVLLGMVAPLLLHRREDWLGARSVSVAALLVLAGGFLLRVIIVFSSESIEI